MHFGDLFKQLMQEKMRTDQQLAELSGVPKFTIISWREGRTKRPRNDKDLIRIAEALHLSREEADGLLSAAKHATITTRLEIAERDQDQEMLGQLAYWAQQPTPPPSLFPSSAEIKDAPFQAPSVPPHFVGRQQLISEMSHHLQHQKRPILALVGMGGIGKTSLAAHTAHLLQSSFADGILWGNPYASDPMTILDLWGKEYGRDFSGLSDIESRAAAVRTLLTDKKTLIVLDNVEDAALARPLLPSGRECAVLMASRNLDVALALDAHVLEVTPLSSENSIALLEQILGADRIQREIEAARRIGELLHHLPLAVEIAAKRLKSRARMSLKMMAERLERTQHRLGLSIGDQAVRASFQVSWDSLNDPLRETFTGMALFGGRPFGAEGLTSVVEKDSFDIEDDLYNLVSLSLVSETNERQYQQHLLLVDFAAEKLIDRSVKEDRYLDYYLRFAEENREEFSLLEPEWPNLTAAITLAQTREAWDLVLRLSDHLSTSWLRYGRYAEAEEGYRLAKEAAQQQQSQIEEARSLLRWAEIDLEKSEYDTAWEKLNIAERIFYELEDGPGIARTHYFQGFIKFDLGEAEKAKRFLEKSREMQVERGDRLGEAKAINLLAYVAAELENDQASAEALGIETLTLLRGRQGQETAISAHKLLALTTNRQKRFAEAKKHAEEAITLSRGLNKLAEIGDSMRILAMIHLSEEQYRPAKKLGTEALTIFQRLGNRRFEAMVTFWLAEIGRKSGDLDQARLRINESLTLFEEIKDKSSYGFALSVLGEINQAAGDFEAASSAWKKALDLANYLNHSLLAERVTKNIQRSMGAS